MIELNRNDNFSSEIMKELLLELIMAQNTIKQLKTTAVNPNEKIIIKTERDRKVIKLNEKLTKARKERDRYKKMVRNEKDLINKKENI
jgi:hypothetical protein